MKLLADENIDRAIITRLRADGHDVAAIAEESPGLPDSEVLIRACQAGVLLITGDKDFGELVYRHRQPHAGVLFLRLAGTTQAEKCELVSRALAEQAELLPGAFSVLERDELRIRRSPPINN